MKIRAIHVEVVRSTSLIRKALRWEVPLLRHRLKAELRLHTISAAAATPDDLVEVGDVDAAYQDLLTKFGTDEVTAEYPTKAAFADAYKATVSRDGDTRALAEVSAAEERRAQADAALREQIADLSTIKGVNEAIARGLIAARMGSIEDVANADLDTLEAVSGIGPGTAPAIKASALEILISQQTPN